MGKLGAQPQQLPIFTHLGSRDGLASDEIAATVQDKKGFIWIATSSGLQRFDGQRFLIFHNKAKDPTSIPNNKIHRLLLDKKDRLWLLCSEGKVGYFNTSTFKFHEVPIRFDTKALKISPIAIHTDSFDNLMLMIARGGILFYNEAADEFSEKYTPFKLPKQWKVSAMYYDSVLNNYWITSDSGLAKYNIQKKTLSWRSHNIDKDETIRAFKDVIYASLPFMDKSGRFWLHSWYPRGPGPMLYSYDPVTKKRKEWEEEFRPVHPIYHEIHSIRQLHDGRIWIYGYNIMAYLPPNGKTFQFVHPDKAGEFSIRYDRVNCLYEDKERNIWVSTNKGIFRFNPSAQLFHIIPNKRPNSDSVYTPDVSDILQTKSGEIIVTTWGNGMFSYDNEFNPLPVDYVKESNRRGEGLTWCVTQLRNGDIWRGNQDGWIFITSAATRKTRQVNPPVFNRTTVRQIAEDSKGNVWIGSHSGLLVKWNPGTDSFTLVMQVGTIYRLMFDKQGTLWVATGGTGVYHIDPVTSKVIAQYTSEAPAGKRLMGISALDIVQHNDSIYMIASECLNILNVRTGNIKYFTAENGLPSNTVNNLIEDKRGFIWLTTDSRLCRFNLEEQLLSTFNEEDGMPPGDFNYPSGALLHDGRIAFGRFHDFVVFDPSHVTPETMVAPSIEITGFSLMNEWLPMDSLRNLPEINLRHNQNSVVIQFSTLTYLNHFAVEYMLEGIDKQWIASFGDNQAIYTYLPPGNYTFKVRSLSGGNATSAEATLKISVRTPFWRSWWFYTLLALLVIALFYWEDRERLRRKGALQKVRSDIAGNLHNEINLALNNINVLSEIARIKADKNPEESKTYINEIHNKSHNMIIAMDDMLWSIDPANDNMGKAIERIKEFVEALRHRYGALIHLHTDQKVLTLKPDMKVRHEVLTINKFALRLLIEELKAPQTSIQIDHVRSQLQLSIFAHNVRLQDAGNPGIKIVEEMKRHAASISAVLEFQSDEKGTGVILAVRV